MDIKRKLVYGVGINDVNEPTKTIDENCKQIKNPFYVRWSDMLRRSYDPKYLKAYPTYKGVTVCDDWLLFSNFRTWMGTQDWKGKELDKDLLVPNNKIYSPETCLFISQHINSLLITNKSKRGEFPVGVCLHKASNKFTARISIYSKCLHLGYFLTPEEASKTYIEAKNQHIKEVAETQEEPLKTALLQHLL